MTKIILYDINTMLIWFWNNDSLKSKVQYTWSEASLSISSTKSVSTPWNRILSLRNFEHFFNTIKWIFCLLWSTTVCSTFWLLSFSFMYVVILVCILYLYPLINRMVRFCQLFILQNLLRAAFCDIIVVKIYLII